MEEVRQLLLISNGATPLQASTNAHVRAHATVDSLPPREPIPTAAFAQPVGAAPSQPPPIEAGSSAASAALAVTAPVVSGGSGSGSGSGNGGSGAVVTTHTPVLDRRVAKHLIGGIRRSQPPSPRLKGADVTVDARDILYRSPAVTVSASARGRSPSPANHRRLSFDAAAPHPAAANGVQPFVSTIGSARSRTPVRAARVDPALSVMGGAAEQFDSSSAHHPQFHQLLTSTSGKPKSVSTAPKVHSFPPPQILF